MTYEVEGLAVQEQIADALEKIAESLERLADVRVEEGIHIGYLSGTARRAEGEL